MALCLFMKISEPAGSDDRLSLVKIKETCLMLSIIFVFTAKLNALWVNHLNASAIPA